MSATNRGSVREERDFYATPDYSVFSLLRACPWLELAGKRWLEPAAVGGAIIDAVNRYAAVNWTTPALEWTAIDIQFAPEFDRRIRHFEMSYLDYEPSDEFDVIITNPAYLNDLPCRYLDHSRRFKGNPIIIQLLRLNFYGSQRRSKWWQSNIPDGQLTLSERPRFVRGGSDSCEYSWFIWSPFGNMGIHVLPAWKGTIPYLPDSPKVLYQGKQCLEWWQKIQNKEMEIWK